MLVFQSSRLVAYDTREPFSQVDRVTRLPGALCRADCRLRFFAESTPTCFLIAAPRRIARYHSIASAKNVDHPKRGELSWVKSAGCILICR